MYDVRLPPLSSQEITDAYNALTVPRIKDAFKATLNRIEAQTAGAFALVDNGDGSLEAVWKGERLATLRRYHNQSRVFWQCYYNGRNYRRKSAAALGDLLISIATPVEDLL